MAEKFNFMDLPLCVASGSGDAWGDGEGSQRAEPLAPKEPWRGGKQHPLQTK